MTDLIPVASDLDALSDPAQRIIVSCERAKTWLAEALAGDQIEQIVELKSQAEAIRIYSMQKQLGQDAELSAAEVVRRCERGIGIAIRKGQAAGRIGKRSAGRPKNNGKINGPSKGTFIQVRELVRDKHESSDAYDFTDGVSDEEFENAISVAKGEQNLSHSNVRRKLGKKKARGTWEPLESLVAQGLTSEQIAKKLKRSRATVAMKAAELGIVIPADRVMSRTKRLNHTRILYELIASLESLIPSVDMIEIARVDATILCNSLEPLDQAIEHLTRLRKQIKRGIK